MTIDIGRPVIDLGLERINALLQLVGSPHQQLEDRKIPIVHVTGTNGKGSTVEMIASGLREDSVVGVFTSPYLLIEQDSIRVFRNNKPTNISSDDWKKIQNHIFSIVRENDQSLAPPTDFEVLFTTALIHFASQLDLTHLVIEVGMGGRLDATNVFQKTTVCVVTSIGLDHQKFLGDTREKICVEKCGIFKRNCHVIVNGEIDDPCLEIIADKFAMSGGKSMTVVDPDDTHNLVPPLNGSHQNQLFGIAIEVIQVLQKTAEIETIQDRIRQYTKLPGRLERRNDDSKFPSLVLDGAHNEQSAIALRQFIDIEKVLEKKKSIVWIIGVSEGRSETILPHLLQSDDICVCVNFCPEDGKKSTWVKCTSSTELAKEAVKYCYNVYSIDGLVEEGIAFATSRYDANSHLFVVAGSLYLVRNYLQCCETNS